MLFLISPAKKLDFSSSSLNLKQTQPFFIEQAEELIHLLRNLSLAELQALMDISPALAELNQQRYQSWSKEQPKEHLAAILAFAGDVYQGLEARSLSLLQLEWLQQHLLILSGLYGLLRPFDMLQPYRLEMGSRLQNPLGNHLVAYWSERITAQINQLSSYSTIVNLASEEYAKVLLRKQLNLPCIDCVFQEYKDGKYKVIGIYAKQARGRLLRYATELALTSPEELQNFDWDGYRFNPKVSTASTFVFQRKSC